MVVEYPAWIGGQKIRQKKYDRIIEINKIPISKITKEKCKMD
jgi:hypothetical protein